MVFYYLLNFSSCNEKDRRRALEKRWRAGNRAAASQRELENRGERQRPHGMASAERHARRDDHASGDVRREHEDRQDADAHHVAGGGLIVWRVELVERGEGHVEPILLHLQRGGDDHARRRGELRHRSRNRQLHVQRPSQREGARQPRAHHEGGGEVGHPALLEEHRLLSVERDRPEVGRGAFGVGDGGHGQNEDEGGDGVTHDGLLNKERTVLEGLVTACPTACRTQIVTNYLIINVINCQLTTRN